MQIHFSKAKHDVYSSVHLASNDESWTNNSGILSGFWYLSSVMSTKGTFSKFHNYSNPESTLPSIYLPPLLKLKCSNISAWKRKSELKQKNKQLNEDWARKYCMLSINGISTIMSWQVIRRDEHFCAKVLPKNYGIKCRPTCTSPNSSFTRRGMNLRKGTDQNL